MSKQQQDRKQRPRRGRQEEKPEFEQRLVDLARVTRVMRGGKRMSFRACVVIGDMKGRVGYGIAKGADVSMAITKAVQQAKKNMVTVPLVKETIPHALFVKFKAARVMVKPAVQGTGVKAGGAMRVVMELAGVKNVVAKIMGSNNKVNIVKATIEALGSLRPTRHFSKKKKAQPKKEA